MLGRRIVALHYQILISTGCREAEVYGSEKTSHLIMIGLAKPGVCKADLLYGYLSSKGHNGNSGLEV
jgi:hypothetical protein